MVDDGVVFDAQQMVDATGVPYYQLNYWTTRQYLVATRRGTGSGHRFQWPASEVMVARLMRILTTELEMSPAKASEVARCGGLVTRDGWYRLVLRWEEITNAGPVRDGSPGPGVPDRARAPVGVPSGRAGQAH